MSLRSLETQNSALPKSPEMPGEKDMFQAQGRDDRGLNDLIGT